MMHSISPNLLLDEIGIQMTMISMVEDRIEIYTLI